MKELDAVLVHAYYLKPPSRLNNLSRTDLRGHMQVVSAADMYRRGEVKKLFLAGGYFFGQEKPSIAEVMSWELIRRGVPKEDIVIKAVALETSEEINAFLEEFGDKENLGSVANRIHNRRIKLIHEKLNIVNIRRFNADAIIKRISLKHARFVEKFNNSWSETIFLARESLVIIPYILGFSSVMSRLTRDPLVGKIKSTIDKAWHI